jgi:hypothetical protein
VARLFGDHGEREKAQLAIVEQPVAAATAQPMPAAVAIAPVTATRQILGVGEATV